jgi:hypothetical protein
MVDFISREVVSFSPSLAELVVDRAIVERDLGYGSRTPPDMVRELIYEVLPQLPSRTSIQCGFRILDAGSVNVSGDFLTSGAVQFLTGPIITGQLKKSISLALFVSTAGPEMEKWTRELMEGGDMMKAYIIDAVASEVVEQASEWLEKRVEEHVLPRGWKITNRYSPGYCDWPVSEQHKLFSFLPDRFCGVSLTSSALMMPIKSLSGVIGLGPDVQRGAYQCKICDLKDCYRRRDEPELATEPE